MDWSAYRSRFALLADALNAAGGFAPAVRESVDANGLRSYELAGASNLVQYPRESAGKFAARNKVAVYENHLRSAVDRFVGFLARKRPHRSGAEAPLAQLFVQDADLRGSHLDGFLIELATQARARGTALVVVDKLDGPAPATLGEQQRRRAVPYLRLALPEDVTAWRLDDVTGLFASVTLAAWEWWDDELIAVERTYTTTGWEVRKANGGAVLAAGEHPFGECQVLAFTESGSPFPVLGKYEQIGRLSLRLFNARSELDEILRSQTFSLLTLEVPPEAAALFDPAKTAAIIGTHSILVHQGQQPAFIAPDAGPAATYLAVIEQLRATISRIAMDDINAPTALASQESGAARRMRFDAMNAELAAFAQRLQQFEASIWRLWHRAIGTDNRVETYWPTDYNMADTAAELDILALMQATGFPPAATGEKQLAIAAIEFDNASDDAKAAIDAAITEAAQRAAAEPQPTPQPEEEPAP